MDLTKIYQGSAEIKVRIVIDGEVFTMDYRDYSEYIENLIKEGDIKDDINEIVKCIADSHGIKNLMSN